MKAYSVICFVTCSICGLIIPSHAYHIDEARHVDLTQSFVSTLKQPIEPFSKEHLATLDGPVEFSPIGNIKIIGTKLSSPFYFPVSFTFYSRGHEGSSHTRSLKVESEYLEHRVPGKVSSKWYHFNLIKLMAPLNPWDPEKRTIVIVPGYRSYENEPWMEAIREAWLNLEDVNVILINWSKGNFVMYDTAAANVKIVARQITSLFYYLFKINQIDFYDPSYREKIQFVGHSLGAHIAGNVGHDLNGQVGRITGLDPAGPIFDSLPTAEGLDKNAANLVDVIHTNAGSMKNVYIGVGAGFIKKTATSMFNLLSPVDSPADPTQKLPEATNGTSNTKSMATPWFGIQKPIGHVDYYANGGSLQPGCVQDKLHLCDHGRAKDLYLYALKREMKARDKFKPDGLVMREKLHRPVAFKATSHRDYRTGASILRNCPQLISAMSNPVSDEQRFEAHKNCVIPIDLVASGPDFRRELNSVYKLNLSAKYHDSRTQMEMRGTRDEEEEEKEEDDEDEDEDDDDDDDDENEKGARFYFDTTNEKPFLAEHHLLRLHIPEPIEESKLLWTSGCRLTVKVNSPENTRFALADFDGEFVKLIKDVPGHFHGLVLPFANPSNWQQKAIDFKSSRNSVTEDEDKLNNDAFVQLQYYFAHSMDFQLTHTSGGLRKAFESLSSLIWKPKTTLAGSCRLQIEAVEVLPFNALYSNISVWMKDDVGWDRSPVYEYDLSTVKEKNKCLIDLKSYKVSLNTLFVNSFAIGEQRQID